MEELQGKFDKLNKKEVSEESDNKLKCKVCGKQFIRLLKHLAAKGSKCRKEYSQLDLGELKKQANKKKCALYKTKNKEKLKVYKKVYDKANKAKITNYKRTYDKENKSKIKGYNAKYYKKKRKDLSQWESYLAYKAETRWGPTFACICCHRMLFSRSVHEINIDKYREKYSNIFDASVDMKALKDPIFKAMSNQMKNEENYWMCNSCDSQIKKFQMEYNKELIKRIAENQHKQRRNVTTEELIEEFSDDWTLEETLEDMRSDRNPKYPLNEGCDAEAAEAALNPYQDLVFSLEDLITDFHQDLKKNLEEGETVINNIFGKILCAINSSMETKEDDWEISEYRDALENILFDQILMNEDPDLNILGPDFPPEGGLDWDMEEDDTYLTQFHKIKFLIRALHEEISKDFNLTDFELFCNLYRWSQDPSEKGFEILYYDL